MPQTAWGSVPASSGPHALPGPERSTIVPHPIPTGPPSCALTEHPLGGPVSIGTAPSVGPPLSTEESPDEAPLADPLLPDEKDPLPYDPLVDVLPLFAPLALPEEALPEDAIPEDATPEDALPLDPLDEAPLLEVLPLPDESEVDVAPPHDISAGPARDKRTAC
jgi:hypothetical protein